jgi:hypothetical protein
MAKQQRMFIATVTAVYCGLAPAGWQPRWGPGDPAPGGTASAWGLPAAALLVILAGSLATAARRLARAARRLRGEAKG